jgi:vitamin B12 transporter
VVVTATRVPMPASVVSSAVTVLHGADLQAQGIRTVAQALGSVPGVHVVETGSYGGQTSLFTRGGESDYTKVLLDGVPLNQAGGGIDLANFTTDNIERIEIVRGPASVLYGSDAVTGVIQIFTKKGASSHSRVGGELRAGTYGSADGAFDAAGGTDKVSYSARVSRFSSDGLYPYNNNYRNSVVSAGLKLTPDARSDVSLTYRYGDAIYHIPTDGGGAPVDSNQRAAERGPVLSLSATQMFGGHWEGRVGGALHEARLFYNDEPDSPGEDGTFWSKDWVRRASANGLLTWRQGEKVAVTAGIEHEQERQRGSSEFTSSGGGFGSSIDVRRHTTGYFLQGVFAAGRAALTAGGRLDDNSEFDTHATYRAGVVYRALAGTHLRVSAGTGFKEPTFFENFASGFVQGDSGLKPERSTSWEVGVEQGMASGRGSITVTYFNQRFRDLIEFGPAPYPGGPNYFNVTAALSDGIETALSANLSAAITLGLRYTYLHTRVEESASPNDPDGLFVPGKPLIRRPTHEVNPEVTANLARTHVTVGVKWVGERDDLDFNRPTGQHRVTLDPYARANIAAEYDLGRIILAGRVENVFNDQTEEIAGFRPRGRTVFIGGRVSIGI